MTWFRSSSGTLLHCNWDGQSAAQFNPVQVLRWQTVIPLIVESIFKEMRLCSAKPSYDVGQQLIEFNAHALYSFKCLKDCCCRHPAPAAVELRGDDGMAGGDLVPSPRQATGGWQAVLGIIWAQRGLRFDPPTRQRAGCRGIAGCSARTRGRWHKADPRVVFWRWRPRPGCWCRRP